MESNEKTIDLLSLLQIFLKHIKFIILITLLGAVAAFTLAYFIIEKQYTSTASVYVFTGSSEASTDGLNYNDISTAQKILNTCQQLFKSDTMIAAVQDNLKNKYGVDLKDAYIKDAITIETTTDQLILNIIVTTTDPEVSAMIANLVQENADQIYKEVIQFGNVKSVDSAQIPLSPSSPNVKIYTAVGLLAGLLIACLIVFITESADTKIKPKDDLFEEYGIPVFAEIMDFAAADTNTGGYDYEYSNK